MRRIFTGQDAAPNASPEVTFVRSRRVCSRAFTAPRRLTLRRHRKQHGNLRETLSDMGGIRIDPMRVRHWEDLAMIPLALPVGPVACCTDLPSIRLRCHACHGVHTDWQRTIPRRPLPDARHQRDHRELPDPVVSDSKNHVPND